MIPYRDNRALATGIIGFIAILVIGALIFTMLNQPMQAVFDAGSTQAQNQDATDAIALHEQIWNAVLYFVVFLGGVFIISRSVFEGRGGPR